MNATISLTLSMLTGQISDTDRKRQRKEEENINEEIDIVTIDTDDVCTFLQHVSTIVMQSDFVLPVVPIPDDPAAVPEPNLFDTGIFVPPTGAVAPYVCVRGYSNCISSINNHRRKYHNQRKQYNQQQKKQLANGNLQQKSKRAIFRYTHYVVVCLD